MSSPRPTAVATLVLALSLGPHAHPAGGQSAPPTIEAGETTSSSIPPAGSSEDLPGERVPLPPIGEDQAGSPAVFVILSLLGTSVAVAIMAVTWIRTRAD